MDKTPSTSSSKSTEGNSPEQASNVLIGEVAQGAKQVAVDLAARARRLAEQQLAEAQMSASERIGNVADALRNTGDQLRAQNADSVSGYVDQAVDQLDAASDYLQERSFSELIKDAAAFARREPAIVFGGAFVLGIIAGRFLKSSGLQPTALGSPGSSFNETGSASVRSGGKSIGGARASQSSSDGSPMGEDSPKPGAM